MNTCDYCGNNVVAYTECLTCGAHKSRPLSHNEIGTIIEYRGLEPQMICQAPSYNTVINQVGCLKELYYSENPFLAMVKK